MDRCSQIIAFLANAQVCARKLVGIDDVVVTNLRQIGSSAALLQGHNAVVVTSLRGIQDVVVTCLNDVCCVGITNLSDVRNIAIAVLNDASVVPIA